jgi:DNA-binding CsgD family transcriptional regulator
MMSDKHLSVSDLRFASRLIHEVCELGQDAVQWNTHLLQSLEHLLESHSGSAYVIYPGADPSNVGFPFQLHHNLNDTWNRYIEMGDVSDQPHTQAIMARVGTDFTVTRQELVDDATWYASEFYQNVARRANWDQMICSQVMIQSVGAVHGLGIGRMTGAPAFGERERALCNFVHTELAYLWRKPSAVEIDSLSKRLRETISCMQRGLSRKEIATELQISPHTVHSYERQLFENFKVSGRGELLARLAKAIRPTLPRLSKNDNSRAL